VTGAPREHPAPGTTVHELASAARRRQRATRRAEARRRRRARRSVIWRNRRLAYLVGLVLVVSASGAGAVVTRIELPAIDERLAQTTFVCAADVDPASGQVCGPDNALVQLAAEQDRSVVDYERIPALVIDAVVAAEDQEFFSHRGVDPTSIARAALSDLRGSESLQGSTSSRPTSATSGRSCASSGRPCWPSSSSASTPRPRSSAAT
jgi:membrane peptidoglycan carboxypeptidase